MAFGLGHRCIDRRLRVYKLISILVRPRFFLRSSLTLNCYPVLSNPSSQGKSSNHFVHLDFWRCRRLNSHPEFHQPRSIHPIIKADPLHPIISTNTRGTIPDASFQAASFQPKLPYLISIYLPSSSCHLNTSNVQLNRTSIHLRFTITTLNPSDLKSSSSIIIIIVAQHRP